MKPKGYVSDHALIRYLERVLGYDLEKIRQSILRDCQSGIALGSERVKVGKIQYRIGVGGCIVTVVNNAKKKPKFDGDL